MNVNISVKKSDQFNLVEALTSFSLIYLKLDRSLYTLDISAQKNLVKNSGSWGMAGHMGKNIYVAIDSKASLSQTMQTFAHEMIHVKQIATGLLKFDEHEEGTILWRGVNLSHLPYLSRPWEIQAIKETPLLVQHFEQFILNNFVEGE